MVALDLHVRTLGLIGALVCNAVNWRVFIDSWPQKDLTMKIISKVLGGDTLSDGATTITHDVASKVSG